MPTTLHFPVSLSVVTKPHVVRFIFKLEVGHIAGSRFLLSFGLFAGQIYGKGVRVTCSAMFLSHVLQCSCLLLDWRVVQ